jgi:hypothetical protein
LGSIIIGKSTKTVQNCIETLKKEGRIKRVGSATYDGHWEIIEKKKDKNLLFLLLVSSKNF